MKERIGKMGQEKVRQISEAMNEVFVGKEEIVEKVLICLLAGGLWTSRSPRDPR